MNKSFTNTIKKISCISIITIIILVFNGCGASKFYYTKAKQQEHIHVEKQIDVKIDVTQSGVSYTGVGTQTLKDDIKDLIAENKLFVEKETADKVLKIHVENLSEDGALSLSGAVITGLTLGIAPNVVDREIIVNIQLDDMQDRYEGEIVHTQGTGYAGENYTQDYSMNLVKNLVKNALNEFTLKYNSYHHKIK